jgi:hypothetical protein
MYKFQLNRHIRSDELLIFPLYRTASELHRSATPMSALSEASTPAHDAASAMDAQQLHQLHQHAADAQQQQQQQQHNSNGPSPVNDSTATRKGELSRHNHQRCHIYTYMIFSKSPFSKASMYCMSYW